MAFSNNCEPSVSLLTDSLPVSSGTPGAKDFPQSPCCVEARKGFLKLVKLAIPEYLRAWSQTEENAGSSIAAGLPELEGNAGGYVTSAADKYATGVFSSSGNPFGNGNPEVGNHSRTLIFKASNGNNIFGNSNTVMPSSINIPCLYLGRAS